ncbi:ZIP family metal transporter [Mycoplasmopsis cynos]|uniref:Metal cation transporter, ZIP family n=3 Tax=Mycoplasmopsis cynos TaxID=171284 RepID=L0RUV9_MYCC1|nr:ZIP family metal transporter [Mycoplasmopsis cynos]TQC54821.1 metal transporter [Mycoplasmopsis cynos]WQQ14762.1 ZIP family metal transporter [Mycoplasmopsis cynos]WQQ16817.1 ZIP family metal transporter [Mycoplasmopsis cynos]WQQ17461.1 ZIP family metal transporter [Mycoplasmopsis cynos]WQQ18416.1 ZIP family metal transporter [Mycoplasmopsis cynos]
MQWVTNLYLSINNSINIGWLSQIILILIFLGAMLCVPIFIGLFFPIIGRNFKKSYSIYIHAFSTGFFLVLATFGFLRESLESASLFAFAKKGADVSQYTIYAYNILLIISGLIIGLIFSFVVKFVISYKLNKKLLGSKQLSSFIHEHTIEEGHSHNHLHAHDVVISNSQDRIEIVDQTLFKKTESKLKIIALLLLLTHRIPEGLLLGYNLSLFIPNDSGEAFFSITTAYFLSLVLHLIPEEVIFYVRLKDAGFSPIKALLLSFLGLSLFLPFMIIGMFVGSIINDAGKAIMFAAIGGIFLFTALVEFFPEIYHINFNKKKWIFTLIVLFLGILVAAFILSFHSHSHIHP